MAMEQKFTDGSDEFPVGMRVLAVDDDPACLKILEALLRKCKYHVTTTNQVVLALQMLRENKDKFDLVISDVCMPDMDGFKLLELVGLEMDLPVIMLSAYGDTAHVTKGIYHGACDYLLKPVRYEELKLIWQHVIRRKFDKNRRDEVGDGSLNQSRKLTKKTKDPSTQKKPRLIWTKKLHNKFVAVVNHLGVDNAFPTCILKMMKEDNLTKENVASHLQKYRGYLKRINQEASLQGSMVISPNMMLDSASLQACCVPLPTFTGFDKTSFGSFSPSLIDSSSSAASMDIFGISSSVMGQESGQQKSTGPVNLQRVSNVNEPTTYPISRVIPGENSSSYHFSVTQNAPENAVLPLHLCYGNQSGGIQSSPIQSSSYVLNDCFNPMNNNIEGTVFRPNKDIIEHKKYADEPLNVSYSSIDPFLDPCNVDPRKRRRNPDSFIGYVQSGSNFIGQSSSVDPLYMQLKESNITPTMQVNSSCFGSLEDIAIAIMRKDKGKGKVMSEEGHSGYYGFTHSSENYIYT